VHRIGQRLPVSCFYLLAPGTADDVMWPMVNRKLQARTLKKRIWRAFQVL
jgi:hypothetical protein